MPVSASPSPTTEITSLLPPGWDWNAFLDGCIEKERTAGRDDLYHFTKQILGYALLTDDDHGPLARTLQDKTITRGLLLWPRETFKTTLATIGRALWLAVRDPNTTILLASGTAAKACEMLGEIIGHVQHDEYFRAVYGDLMPGLRRDERKKWTGSEATVATRTHARRHATWTAVGAETNLVSAHYDHIIVDDLVGPDDRESAAIRERKKRWLRDLIAILRRGGSLWLVGTRWHPDDAYHWLLDELNPSLPERDRYYVDVRDCYTPEGVSSFPAIFSTEELTRKAAEMTDVQFSATMRNRPIASGSALVTEADLEPWLYDYATLHLDTLAHYGACDPSLGQSAQGDPSAIGRIGVTPEGWLAVLACSIALRPVDQIQSLILDWHAERPFLRFGYETVQFQALAAKQLLQAAQAQWVYVPVVELKQSQNKVLRIQTLQPLIRTGMLRFRRDWRTAYPELMHQLFNFPFVHDDGPDMLEMIVRVIQAQCSEVVEETSVIEDPIEEGVFSL